MAEVEKIIVDASVAIKWFTTEEHSDKALALRELYRQRRVDLMAPDLLIYEVGNALRYNPGFGSREVKRALADLEGLQITLFPMRGRAADLAVDTAFTHGLSLYDAAYIAISIMLNSPYYTADRVTVDKISKPSVRHIANFKP